MPSRIELAAAKGRQLAEKAKTGDFDKAAKALGLTAKTSDEFTESGHAVRPWEAAASSAFTLNPGQVSDVVSLSSNSVVFKVISHTPANEADSEARALRDP